MSLRAVPILRLPLELSLISICIVLNCTHSPVILDLINDPDSNSGMVFEGDSKDYLPLLKPLVSQCVPAWRLDPHEIAAVCGRMCCGLWSNVIAAAHACTPGLPRP